MGSLRPYRARTSHLDAIPGFSSACADFTRGYSHSLPPGGWYGEIVAGLWVVGQFEKNIPRGAEAPKLLERLIGTAKAVPFQNDRALLKLR